jgi:hypothetical protein
MICLTGILIKGIQLIIFDIYVFTLYLSNWKFSFKLLKDLTGL